MPTAIVSSVKQPVGIYLTAGQWTKIEPSPCLESTLLVFALSSVLFHFSPPSPAPQVLAVPPPLLLISCTAGRRHHLVRDVPDK